MQIFKITSIPERYVQTSNPTTFSTNRMSGGREICGISSRILRKEKALASLDPFCRP